MEKGFQHTLQNNIVISNTKVLPFKKAEVNLFGPIISTNDENQISWEEPVQGIGNRGE